MTEGPPKIPAVEQKESLITKEQVIERLKASPEDLAPLNEYLDKREGEIQSSKDALKLNIEVAEIKRDSGRIEGAKEAFKDAAEHAWQEHDEALYNYCMGELEKLSGQK